MSAVSDPTATETHSSNCSSSCYSSDSESDETFDYNDLVRENGSLFTLQYKRDCKAEGKESRGVAKKECGHAHGHRTEGRVRATKSQPKTKAFLNEKCYETTIFDVDVLVNYEHLSKCGRRTDVLDFFYGVQVGEHQDGLKVIVTGLKQFQTAIEVGDWLYRLNGHPLLYQTYNETIRREMRPGAVLRLSVRHPAQSRTDAISPPTAPIIRTILKFENYLVDERDFAKTLHFCKISLMYVRLPEAVTRFCYPDTAYSNRPDSITRFMHAKKNTLLTLSECLEARETFDTRPSYTVMQTTDDTNELLVVFQWKPDTKNILFLSLPLIDESFLPVFETMFANFIDLVLFTYGDLNAALLPGACTRGPNLRQLLHLFFAKFFCHFKLDLSDKLDLKMDRIDEDERYQCLEFEDIVQNAGIVPIPREPRMQINDALTEFEAVDFRDLSIESKFEPRKLFIMGSCFYHNGYLLVSHLNEHDLRQIHTYLRTLNLLELSRITSLRNLVIWHEIFPSSRRGRRDIGANVPARNYGGNSNFSTFLLVVGYDHDIMCAVIESSEPREVCVRPHDWYVENAEQTVRHIRKMNVTFYADRWIEFTFVTGPNRVLQAAKNLATGVDEVAGAADPGNDDDVAVQSTSGSSKWTLLTLGSARKSASSGGYLNDDVEVVDDDEDDEDDDDFCDLLESNSKSSDNRARNVDDDVADLGVANAPDFRPTIQFKLNSETENILLHFVKMDKLSGIMVCSSNYNSHYVRQIYELFGELATQIHRTFARDDNFTGRIQEYGHGFALYPNSAEIGDMQKEIRYWVVGKKLQNGDEFYVCYRDEVPQDVLELVHNLNSIPLE